MARFEFPLQAVLEHRRNLERECQRKAAVIRAELTGMEITLRKLDASVRGAEQDLRTNRLVGRLDLPFLAAHRRYAFAMQRKALDLAQKMAGVQRSLDEAQRNLLEAAKRRKVLEKLRKRQELRWHEHRARMENAALDEMTTQLTFRQLVKDA